MTKIVTFSDIRAAKTVSDYLFVNQVENEISRDSSGFTICIADKQKFARAEQLISEFLSNPLDEKYMGASWQRSQIDDFETHYTQHKQHGLVRFWRRSGWFTKLSSSLLVFIFILQLIGFHPWLYHYLSFPTYLHQIELYQIYRLVTPALMHGDWLHLLMNLGLWLWLIGHLETERKVSFLLGLSLFAALLAHLLEASFTTSAFIGLSGVVCGVLSYVWLAGKRKNLEYVYFPDVVFWSSSALILLGFIEPFGIKVANWAHIGGLVAGILFAYFEPIKKPS
ncbi:rhomboid family intramembrane serine protease [Catenovulum maritimum]|nr:rhomboid family intramembrane serine protease [Catenovulum maritimum]